MGDQVNVTLFGTGGGPGVLPRWSQLIKNMPCNLDGVPLGWLFIYGPPVVFNDCFALYWTPPPGNYAIISPWVADPSRGTLLISSTILLPTVDSLPDGKLKDLAKWIKDGHGGRGVGQFNSVMFLDGTYDSEKPIQPPYPNMCPSLLIGPIGVGTSVTAIIGALGQFNIPEDWLQTTIYEGHSRFRPYSQS